MSAGQHQVRLKRARAGTRPPSARCVARPTTPLMWQKIERTFRRFALDKMRKHAKVYGLI